MRAVGWRGGQGDADDPWGYGIRLSERDRDANFDRTWGEVLVELDGGDVVTVDLSPSFWRSCPELRSADIGRWLLAQGAAPWPKSNPPGIAVRVLEGNRFSARVLKQHTF
jgi:hypothetical protein